MLFREFSNSPFAAAELIRSAFKPYVIKETFENIWADSITIFSTNLLDPINESSFSEMIFDNHTESVLESTFEMILQAQDNSVEAQVYIWDNHPEFWELVDTITYGVEEDSWDIMMTKGNPDFKLYYPEPFIASPSFNHEDLWFIHILHYQYWLWFAFITLVMFYFITFINVVRWCNVRTKPSRETRGVSRSKCADLITATVPVVWAVTIIISETFDATDYHDGFGTGEMIVGIRAYQWGWEYFYPKSLDCNYNVNPSYSQLIGNSLKYNNTSSKNTEMNKFWKFYQRSTKNSNVNAPSNLLLTPSEDSRVLNLFKFNEIGVNPAKPTGSFKRINYFSKSQPQFLYSSVSEFEARYKKLNLLYMNDTDLLNASSFGSNRQHNFNSISSTFNNSKGYIDEKSVNKFLDYNYKINYNNTLKNAYLPKYDLTANVIEPTNITTNVNLLTNTDFSDTLSRLSSSSYMFKLLRKTAIGEYQTKTLIDRMKQPLLTTTNTNEYNKNTLIYSDNNINLQLTDKNIEDKLPTSPAEFFFKNKITNEKVKKDNMLMDSTFSTNRLVTNILNTKTVATGTRDWSDLDTQSSADTRFSNSYIIAASQTNSGLPTFVNYADYDFLNWIGFQQFESTYNESNINLQNYSYARFAKLGFNRAGKRGMWDRNFTFFDYNTNRLNTNTVESLLLIDGSLLSKFGNNKDWISSLGGGNINSTNHVLSSNLNIPFTKFNNNTLFLSTITNTEEKVNLYQDIRDLNVRMLLYIPANAKFLVTYKYLFDSIDLLPFKELYTTTNDLRPLRFLKAHIPSHQLSDLLELNNTTSSSLFSDSNPINSQLINTKNFNQLFIENEIEQLDNLYADYKTSKNSLLNKYLISINNDNNFNNFVSYAQVLDAYRDFVDNNNIGPVDNNYNSEYDLNKNYLNYYTHNTNVFSDNIKLLSNSRSAISAYNAIQKVFKPRGDENRSHMRITDISNSYIKLPFINANRVNYENLLGKNKTAFFSTNFYKKSSLNNTSFLMSSWNSLNTKIFETPFLMSLVSDATRYMWFDWYAQWSSIAVQPASAGRYSLMGVRYSNKGFEFESNSVNEIQESENYLTKIAHARKNYLPSWTSSTYLYNRVSNWYRVKSILLPQLNNTSLTNSYLLFNIATNLENTKYKADIKGVTNKEATPVSSTSIVNTPHQSFWKPITAQSNYFYSQSILNDIMSKRSFMYKKLLSNQGIKYTFDTRFSAAPNNTIVEALKSSISMSNPINLQCESSRDFLYSTSSFLKLLFIKDFIINLSESALNSPVNVDKITSNVLFKFFGESLSGNKVNEVSSLYKSQYRPMRKGITNMIRIQSTSAIAMPIETRLHIVASSRDIIHSWAIPSAGIKIDCIPGFSSHRITIFLVSGIFWGQCMEICGRYHHWMPIVVYFMKRDLFFLWCTHFIHYSNLNDVFLMNDKQLADHVRVISYSTSSWAKEVLNSL